MSDAFFQMVWPLLACFVLVGIHAYLGIHVIARKVIFVDLALAQIAGFGAVYGVFIGLSIEHDPWLIKGVSIVFTLLGAVLFSFTRTPDERVPHEAIIGIIYAAALSLTVLITANLPHGADEVRHMLAGNILWVTKKEVLVTATLYAAVGAFHVICRKQFFSLSDEKALRLHSPLYVKLWDFLFYATFGVVVTSSVGIGGVLLVFGYLIIPSVIGIMLARSTKWRLIVGWSSGALMSLLGVVLSYHLDLPSGPSIVVLLGAMLVVVTLVNEMRSRLTRGVGLVHLAIIFIIGLIFCLLPIWFQFELFKSQLDVKSRRHLLMHENNSEGELIVSIKSSLATNNDDEVLRSLELIKDHKFVALVPQVLPFLQVNDDRTRELAARVLAELKDRRALPDLATALVNERDLFIKIELAQALLQFGDTRGLLALKEIMAMSKSEFAREDAHSHIVQWIDDAPSVGLLEWLNQNLERLQFDQTRNRYYVPAKDFQLKR